MADFNIDVGFSSLELKQNAAPVGGGGGSSGGGMDFAGGIGKGFKAALMATGIVGILMNLKVILDVIGFAIGVISSLVGLLVSYFIQFIVDFFKDPGRALTGVVVDIINGFIGGIELLANIFIKGINMLIPGTGNDLEMVEFGRFQKEIVLEGYDEYKKVEQAYREGAATMGDVARAGVDYARAWGDAFLTQSEFEEVARISDAYGTSLLQTAQEYEQLGEQALAAIENGEVEAINNIDRGFDSLNNAMKYLERKADSFRGDRSGSHSAHVTAYERQKVKDFQQTSYKYDTDTKKITVSERSWSNTFFGDRVNLG